MRKLTMLVALVVLVPALAQAKTLEDLLVEKGVITKADAAGVGGQGAAGTKVYWNNGSRIDFPEQGFTSTLYTQVRTRFDQYDYNRENKEVGEDPNQEDRASFSVDMFKLGVIGTALNNEFSYKFEADLGGTSGSKATDAYVEWAACDWLGVRMGQWKTPVSRSYNTTEVKEQFPDRTVLSDMVSFGRQPGAGVKTKLVDGKLQIGGAITNGLSEGEGRNEPGVDGKEALWATARYDVMGKMDPFAEGDPEYTEKAAVNVGASYGYLSNKVVADINDKVNAFSVDANFKMKGISVAGEFLWRQDKLEVVGGDESEKPTVQGGYLQAGYFVMPKELELAARYAYTGCDNGKGVGECAGLKLINQASAGLNYYWWGYHLRGFAGYNFINKKPENSDLKNDNLNQWTVAMTTWW